MNAPEQLLQESPDVANTLPIDQLTDEERQVLTIILCMNGTVKVNDPLLVSSETIVLSNPEHIDSHMPKDPIPRQRFIEDLRQALSSSDLKDVQAIVHGPALNTNETPPQ